MSWQIKQVEQPRGAFFWVCSINDCCASWVFMDILKFSEGENECSALDQNKNKQRHKQIRHCSSFRISLCTKGNSLGAFWPRANKSLVEKVCNGIDAKSSWSERKPIERKFSAWIYFFDWLLLCVKASLVIVYSWSYRCWGGEWV